MFSANGLSVDLRQDGNMVRVLEDVDLQLAAGCVYDLVGPSGCGKSTLLRACARMVELAAGTMTLDGAPADDFGPQDWRAQVCLVPQKPSLLPGTVQDNLLLPWKFDVRKPAHVHKGARGKDAAHLRLAAQQGVAEGPVAQSASPAGVAPGGTAFDGVVPVGAAFDGAPTTAVMRDYLDAVMLGDVDLTRDVSQLSGGQAARVALVRAFLTQPRVLLLDEVDAALDAESSAAVSALTQRMVAQGVACLRIRHRASDGLAQETLRMEAGRIVERTAHVVDGAKVAGLADAVWQIQQERTVRHA